MVLRTLLATSATFVVLGNNPELPEQLLQSGPRPPLVRLAAVRLAALHLGYCFLRSLAPRHQEGTLNVPSFRVSATALTSLSLGKASLPSPAILIARRNLYGLRRHLGTTLERKTPQANSRKRRP
jgi:hypothetical protein